MSDREPLISIDDDESPGVSSHVFRRSLNQSYLHDDSEVHGRTQQWTQDTTIRSNSLKHRIVLLGKTGSGKSSTGNTILGRECFQEEVSPESVTKTCERGEVEEGDQTISVIDTPGLFDTTMSTQKMKKEIVKCVEMSVPGPHVFLLVINIGRFTEEEKNTVQWIQENFGEEAARYTIILFTHADQLKKKPLDEYIRESNDLQALVNVCGGRVHSFNNEDMENRDQVTELLEKIEKMVKKNRAMNRTTDYYTNDMYQDAQKKIYRDKLWSAIPRIVLLGKSKSGKTSTRKIIVGRDQRRNSPDSATKSCELKEAHVGGKRMKIIDTPGLIDASEEEIKDEIEKIVFMSGPYVFLLVIRLDEKYKDSQKAVKWIQENFGEEAAAHHTIILFTHDEHLRDRSLDEYIRESNDLMALVKKCDGRFHSFNINNMRNSSQVTEMMEKIEKMVEVNEGCHYTCTMLQEAQRKKHRDRFWSGNPRIVLLGKSRSGKTSAVETILGRESFESRNSSNSFTNTCELQEAHVNGRNMKLIDTPGLMMKMKDECMKCVKLSAPGPHVFLLVIRLDERFTDEEKNTVNWIQENIGEEAARYTIILFTHADHLMGKSLDQYISERRFLQLLVNSCGGRFHSFNNEDRSDHNQVTELLEKIENMAEGNGWSHCTNEMFQNILKKYLLKLKILAASLGPVGTAAVVGGGVLLGVVEIAAAPIVLVAVGSAFLVGGVVAGGILFYERFVKKD